MLVFGTGETRRYHSPGLREVERLRRKEITAVLRARIERAVSSGALCAGDKLPSTRSTSLELKADPRVVNAAYRNLEEEGLVEIRSRSGIYLAAAATPTNSRKPARDWVAAVLAEGVVGGFSSRAVCDFLRDAANARRITVAVVAATLDQTAGMARELKADFGLNVVEVLADSLQPGASLPAALRRAHFVLTTDAYGSLVKKIASYLRKPFIVASIRPQLGEHWLRLMKRELYVIATDAKFFSLMTEYLRDAPGFSNIHMLLVGRNDLSRIPADAPTYVTQAARQKLGTTLLPGWLVPPAPLFAAACVREIMNIIVGINTRSWGRETESVQVSQPPDEKT